MSSIFDKNASKRRDVLPSSLSNVSFIPNKWAASLAAICDDSRRTGVGERPEPPLREGDFENQAQSFVYPPISSQSF